MQLPLSGPPPPGTPVSVFHGAPPNVMVQQGPPPGVMMGPGQPPHMGPPHPGLPPPQHVHPGMGPMSDHPGPPRGPPCFNLEYRIHEMNKRLLQRSESPETASLWWEEFATEFFEDDATLTLMFSLEDGPKRYTIGRTLIPRYFRTIYEGGVNELHYILRYPREIYQNRTNTVLLECDRAMMMTTHSKPYLTQVQTDGQLVCEFAFSPIPNQMPDELMPRIRMWHFNIMGHLEFVPKNALLNPDPVFLQDISKNITRQGLTTSTLNYLRLCVILEPMQELMSHHRVYNNVNMAPRDCLSRVLFMKYHMSRGPQPNIAQAMMPPEEQPRQASKRRKRKGSSSGGTTTPTGSGTGRKKGGAVVSSPSPAMTSVSMPSSHVDVMVVQEPSMMGGEYGDEDERFITRLENAQFDPAVASPQIGMNPAASGPPMNLGPHMVSGERMFDPNIVGWPGPQQNLHHLSGSVSSPSTPVGRTNTPANGGSGSLHSQLAASPATMLGQSIVGSLTRPMNNQNGSRQSTPNATPTSFG